jgi:4-amino-4-deoxy-L-arabinose transferase-like glycosyltransferase
MQFSYHNIFNLGKRFAPSYFIGSDQSLNSGLSSASEVDGSPARAWVQQLDWSWIALLLVLGTYLLPGLIGHDPWKQDETYIFGIIHHLLLSGDWVVPMMAGEPFMEKPPLYYWVAALTAKGFSPWLPLHDGARLATGIFMAATYAAIAWAGRQWWGRGYGRYAVLSMIACVGLVFHSHMMLTDVPVLTGFAIATCGLVIALRQPVKAGLLLGVGVGIGFLGKGVLAPGVWGLSCVLLPVLFRQWRQINYLRTLGWALCFSLPFLLIWPIALYLRSYDLFMDWFWLNNVGRYLGFSVAALGAPHTDGFWITTLPWFTFPTLPLAVLSLWRQGQRLWHLAAAQVCLLVFTIMLLVLWSAASARDNYALPLLAPLSILAAPAAAHLSRRWNAWMDWSARLIFGSLIALIWAAWGVMMWQAQPPEWAFLLRYLPADYNPHLDAGAAVFALTLTVGALYGVPQLASLRARGLVSWAAGLTLTWLLLSCLWLPWIDYAKSYRSVFNEMEYSVPQQYRCMASENLGESERAMLSYFLGIHTQRTEVSADAGCDLILVNGLASDQPEQLGSGQWDLLWQGARPGDTRERLWLFGVKRPVNTANYYELSLAARPHSGHGRRNF